MLYLIHFDQPFGHARHYLGWTQSAVTLVQRLDHHRSGSGARLVAVVTAAGIPWRLVRTWDGATRTEERRLKVHGHGRMCPECNPRAMCRAARIGTGSLTYGADEAKIDA